MRTLWASVAAVVAVSLSCGGKPPPPAAPAPPTWVAPALLAQVPADSPYVFALLTPLSEKVRARMFGGFEQQVAELWKTAKPGGGADLEPWIRAALALTNELRGKDMKNWWRELGFDPSGRFVLYGLSLWPVMRIEVADPARLRRVVEHALSAAGVQPVRATLEGRAYWTTGTAEVTFVAAVLDREAVIAVVPTPAVAAALPQVLGIQAPAHSLSATTTVPDLLARHHLMGFLLGYLDAHRIVDIVTGRKPSAVDGPLHAWTGPVPASCGPDLDRLAAVAPRAVFGYRRLDETGFEGLAVLEAPASVTTALQRLHTAAPEVTEQLSGEPLFAMGTAFKVDELVAVLRGVTSELHSHPFACPWLASLNRAGDELATKLAQPLPPGVRDVHGVSIVVDDATLTPPSVEGHLLVFGPGAAELAAMTAAAVPSLAALHVPRDGVPVEVPAKQLGIPLSPIHVAMSADRVAVATGARSAVHAAAGMTSPVPSHSPLFSSSFDAPRLRRLTAKLSRNHPDNLNYLGYVGMSLDVDNDGLRFAAWGSWSTSAALTPAATP